MELCVWILVFFFVWNPKAPDELLHSSPLTLWQVTQREQLHCTPAVTTDTPNVLHVIGAVSLRFACRIGESLQHIALPSLFPLQFY